MADTNNNNFGLPDDLKELLARAEGEDEEPEYDPSATDDTEDEDDEEEYDEDAVADNRGDADDTDVHGGKLQFTEFGREMEQSFIEYSMSVITARALPDVRDGLKPVHRRILYAMKEAGITPSKPHKKSAWTVGEVIGKYHPHGDSAVYDAMVRMAQWFSVRTPLVDGHGNFGNIDGDSAAAMRYTEARLAWPAMELLRDLDKDTIDWQPNYDGSLQEPSVLPSHFPNLLVNGSAGIAVGMATNIPPHNLGEAIDATCLLIDNPDATVDDIMQVMHGPDFPTGAIIMGSAGIREAYSTGRGTLTVRAKAHVESTKTGRNKLVFTEFPYQTNKSALQEKIVQLVNEKRIEGISDMRDESNRKGLRLVIELKNSAVPEVVLNNLYKHTGLQTTFGVNNLALVDGVPKCLSIHDMLQCYINHQVNVVTRRTEFDLARTREKAHIHEGLLLALDNIDEIITIIRSSLTDEEASQRMIERFGFTEIQTTAILEMRLKRLTGLERDKLKEELDGFHAAIEYYESLLADKTKILGVIKEEMLEIKRKFADKRRTEITGESARDLDVEDLIADEDIVVTITHAGYVKRLPVATYRAQNRGGKGLQGVNLKDSDFVERIFVASTHEYMLFFTSKGKVYKLKVHEIPPASRTARGTAIVNILPLEEGETVSAVINTRDFPDDDYLLFATSNGMVKKIAMSEYKNTRRDGIIAINLHDDDQLIAVRRVHDGDKVIMVSNAGKAIKWDASQARAMGRNTSGVKGMNLPDGAKVLGMEISNNQGDLFVITENGYGKRTPVADYPEQNRGGMGVYTIQMTLKKGLLAVCKVVGPQHELMIISNDGVVIRVKVKDISQLGRSTQGVKIMNVAPGDKVAALARMKQSQPKAFVLDGQATLNLDAVTENPDAVDLGDGEDDTVDEELNGEINESEEYSQE